MDSVGRKMDKKVCNLRMGEIVNYETWAKFGPDEDERADDEKCACGRCNGEPEDTSDIEINDKPREGVRETWPGA